VMAGTAELAKPRTEPNSANILLSYFIFVLDSAEPVI